MIINYDQRFVIFSPWKTASSTMFMRLSHLNQSPYSRFYYFNEYLKRIVHQHITVADFKALPENRLELKKVAFVRNPYDRVYSGFLQIQRDLQQQPSLPYPEPWIKNHVLKQLSENEEKLRKSSYEFNEWFRLISPEEIFEIGRNSSLPLHPSHYWTHDADKKFVDFIGKVENFEQDFQKMLEFLEISNCENLQNDNVTDTVYSENSPESKYISKMTTTSIHKINELFHKDFELFEYRMIV